MRRIAIMTDIHGLLEPLNAVLKDIKNKGITEIYSLGDQIGLGPNPKEVLNLLRKNNVKSIMGNSEEYVALGGKPFHVYFKKEKKLFQKWTNSQLSTNDVNYIKTFKHSYDLEIGGKKIGLCHFLNDVRIDFPKYSTWSYQANLKDNKEQAIKQFYYVNSDEQRELINCKYNSMDSKDLGYKSCYDDPILGGKKLDYYDEVIQGHVHFGSLVKDDKVIVRTVRALGMAYEDKPNNKAYYIIINEEENGYNIEECYVDFDRNSMLKKNRGNGFSE